MDSVIVSTGERQGLESDGFMIWGAGRKISWSLWSLIKFILCNFLLHMSTKFSGICSLRQVRGKCVVFVCPVIFFISSIWKGCDFWYYGNKQCDCKASLASVFEWCPLLLSKDGNDVGLCWDRMVKGLTENPALSREIPESSATLTGCWSRGICDLTKAL